MICKLVINKTNLSKKSKKRLAKIKMIKIKKKRNKQKSNTRNQINLDLKEEIGLKHIMNLKKKFIIFQLANNKTNLSKKSKKRLAKI